MVPRRRNLSVIKRNFLPRFISSSEFLLELGVILVILPQRAGIRMPPRGNRLEERLGEGFLDDRVGHLLFVEFIPVTPLIAVNVINRMTALGMPESAKIVT